MYGNPSLGYGSNGGLLLGDPRAETCVDGCSD